MLKKMTLALFALFVGALVAEARDVVTLGIYLDGDSSVSVVGKLPQGVSLGKPKKTKKGLMSFPIHVNLGQTQSAEFQLKVANGGSADLSLFAFKHEKGKKNAPLAVECKKFEINGKPVKGIPRAIRKWQKVAKREFQDGDVVTIKLEFAKPEK